MQALILVGGLGTRLKAVLPDDLPKPLASVAGRPFLDYLLNFLRLNGVGRVMLALGYGAGAIRGRYGARAYGMEILYSEEEKPLGTGGAVQLALSRLAELPDPPEGLLIMNGDSIFLANLRGEFNDFIRSSDPLRLLVRPMGSSTRYGSVTLNPEGFVQSFREKQGGQALQGGLMSAGIYCARRQWLTDRLASLPEVFSLEQDFFEPQAGRPLAGQGLIRARPAQGYFIDIGIPEDLTRMNEHVSRRSLFKDWTLFLDRDGVINERIEGGYVLAWDQFRFLPGVLAGLKKIAPLFQRIFVVTNQRCLAKGLLAPRDLEGIHARMRAELGGIQLDGLYLCPHESDQGCGCRKPEVGLFLQAQRDFPDVDFKRSFMVGDSPSDWEAACRLGALPLALGPCPSLGVPPLGVPHFSDWPELAGSLC